MTAARAAVRLCHFLEIADLRKQRVRKEHTIAERISRRTSQRVFDLDIVHWHDNGLKRDEHTSRAMAAISQNPPEFRTAIIAYDQFFLAHVQQTAACNAAHLVMARTCKWLLRMHHLAGADLSLTQEFLAQMIGVRRTSVSGVAADLQNAGMISYSRGRIYIVDIDQIKRWACECDDAINSHYEALYHPL